MKNLPDFEWIDDAATRAYCDNNFVNDETLDLLREDGNVLREMTHGRYGLSGKPFMNVYNINEGRYLLHDPIDRI